MNKLKPCQKEVEALEIIESMLDVADMKNTGPIYADDPPRSGLCRIPEEDAAILRQYIADRRTQPDNEPLTLNPAVCHDCWMPYGGPDWVDTVLPDEQWKLIFPEQDGLLCANCIIKRASRLGGIIRAEMRLIFTDAHKPGGEQE